MDEAANAAGGYVEPSTYAQAMKRPDAAQWHTAAEEEYNAHLSNGTWKLVELPPDRRAIGCRWVFKIKRNADGSVERYKARIVAKGFSQRPGYDFVEIFAPTIRMATVRLILAQAALEDLHMRSIDISHAFLNGDLEEDVYMEQPEGFRIPGGRRLVLHLGKSIYGLKQAGRQWNKKMHAALLEMGFVRIKADAGVYVYERGEVRVIMPIYVDDITAVSKSKAALDRVVEELSKHFKLRDLGETSFLLGIQIQRDRAKRTLSLSQRQYILDILERFNFSDCKPVVTPMEPGLSLVAAQSPTTPEDIAHMRTVPYASAVGALQYLASGTRPDISYTVGVLARFNANPGIAHWNALKHLLRYLKGTLDLKLVYRPDPSSPHQFTTFCDADHGGDKDSGRSTGGYVTRMGTGAVNWSSKLQPIVEYISACEAGKEILWMRNILTELGLPPSSSSPLGIDNQSALTVAKNPEHHGRMKHLDLRFYWLRDAVEAGLMAVSYVPTEEMPADLLTKALPRVKVEYFRRMMGLE